MKSLLEKAAKQNTDNPLVQSTKLLRRLSATTAAPTAAAPPPEHVRRAAAMRIQRVFRTSLYIYRYYMADVFCMHGGQPACQGTVEFGASVMAEPSRFLACADSTSPNLIAKFLTKQWQLKPPEVLITVIGGAQDFALPLEIVEAFSDGLASAATSSNAWVLTGGTDAGVMKMVGTAMQSHHTKVPLIGIPAWGTTNHNAQLASCHGGRVTYDWEAPSINGAPLNPAHSHLILVDSGVAGKHAWGTEIPFRSALEDYLAEVKRVPLVQLVVQGGPGTMRTVASIASKGRVCRATRTAMRAPNPASCPRTLRIARVPQIPLS
jgi:hypothetical protein